MIGESQLPRQIGWDSPTQATQPCQFKLLHASMHAPTASLITLITLRFWLIIQPNYYYFGLRWPGYQHGCSPLPASRPKNTYYLVNLDG